MNAFDGLLPPARLAPAIPERGGPVAIRAAARQRKVQHATKAATTSGALSLALLAFNALIPPAGTRSVEVDPGATRPPAASAPATTAPRSPREHPAGGVATAPTAAASRGAGGGGENRVTPTSLPPVVAPPPATGSPSTRYTRIDREDVDDSLDRCHVRAAFPYPEDSLCVRYSGPAQAKAGQPTDLVFEFCAKTVSVELDFPSRQEIRYLLTRGTSEEVWMGVVAPGGSRYTVEVLSGTCLRYTAHWDGLTSDGRAPAPGEYEIAAWLLDDGSAAEPLPQPDLLVLT